MTMTRPKPLEPVLRSIDATWDRDRWETLPTDDHRYEVIDGVLYSQPNPRLSSYAQCDQIATDGELTSPTLPFRITIAGFFADAPDATV